ncbi:MAG: anthranilate synthase component II [Acidimicrobiales bacterium]
MTPRVLVLDNYDSFVYNLVQYLAELGADPIVRRNDEIDPAGARSLGVAGLVISPGPGRPEAAGVSTELVGELAGELPVLGVCLGHQCIGQAFGAEIVRAPEIVHGSTSPVHHGGSGIFSGIPSPFDATRYHSLIVRRDGLPGCLEVTAETSGGLIMGLRHRELPVTGVQFHPESVLTTNGHRLLGNFLEQLSGSRSRSLR